jgi:hypothetical protein
MLIFLLTATPPMSKITNSDIDDLRSMMGVNRAAPNSITADAIPDNSRRCRRSQSDHDQCGIDVKDRV